ncbi:hypothetical protein IPZ58_03945 [Streptomyces roseoverticillatus]|uniref:hypothetical protein n=1 Tax=Streptomyces roseoverticillatus TaxID=66429 RepID=UPI001F349944|nr:hypothetical protein [Streptomyces roseoverticillatus]MCF3100733.1 hypothetical protein [Streptomyces roseoverticillatus]
MTFVTARDGGVYGNDHPVAPSTGLKRTLVSRLVIECVNRSGVRISVKPAAVIAA